ncbi:MAG: hypothetical protein H6747_08675 [Deltaproteobacteria bacterium]|nr:hypothetical protein [Deltaproteobacteria bacterium]
MRAALCAMTRALPLAVTACLLFGAASAEALPRMSLTAGSPCATCHVSPQGGGPRNEIGWGSELFTRAFGFASVGLPKLDEQESNTFFEGKAMIGIDLRAQLARLGRPKADPSANAADATFSGFTPGTKPDLVYIPMQFMPYLTVLPTEWLTVTGSYNISTLAGSQYPGQMPWEAQVILHGDPMLPTLRAGMIQPTIGIRQDDHTMLQRADAMDPRRPLIPAGYAEWGGELSWHPISWFRVEAGGFLNSNLREASQARVADPVRTSSDGLAYSGRLSLMPQFLDLGLNTWFGASVLGAGELMAMHAFAGVGKNEWGSLQIEAARSTGASGYTTTAFTALASWTAKEWLVVEARGEMATSHADLSGGAQDSETRQLVLGVQFFPLPYVELRPEYRLIKVSHKTAATDEYILGQYTLQTHLFF